MATQTTGGGSTTSFTNAPQAVDDSYTYLEDLLRDNATLYNSSTNTILLDVMSNDLGGNAKALFSVENGDGDLIDDDFELLNKDVDASGCSPWEPTLNGNWVRINNGKIEYRIADGSGVPGQGRSVDSLTAGEVFADEFVYAIRLGNGTLSEAVVKINITGANDNALISGDNDGALSENGVPGTVSGSLIVTDADAGQNELQSIPAGTAGDNGYGTFEVLADGNWTYTLNNGDPAVEGLAAGEVVYDTITVTSEDGTDTEVITITITGTNDAPEVSDVSVLTPVEDGAAVTGSFSGDDVDSDDDGASLTYTIASDPSEGSVVNNGDGTFSFDPEDDFQDLAEGETRQVSFTYTATDSHGAVSNTGTVTVTVTGTNDDPLFSIVGTDSAEETIAETNGGLTASGTLTVTDADTSNVVDTVVTGVTLGGDYGGLTEGDVIGMLALTGDDDLAADAGDSNNLGWEFDSGSEAFDFLAAGESLTLTYQLTTTDDEGATDTQTVTITVTGTNDAAVITQNGEWSIVEDDVPNEITGYLESTDVDGDDNSFVAVTTPTASDNGYGTFTLAADGTYTYTLDNSNPTVNELHDFSSFLYDTFTVTAADGTTFVVNITIFGNNDPAVIEGTIEGSVTEASAADPGDPTATGTLTSTDVDDPPNEFFAVTTPELSVNGYGTFTMTADGTWTYTLDNDHPDVDGLNDGGTLDDSFLVHSIDGTDQLITITIHGANDAIVEPPVYTGDDDPNNFDTKTDIASGTTLVTGTEGDDIPINDAAGAHTIRALGGNDTVNAGNGGDTVYGGIGNDTINGGDGNDSLYGQAGDDIIHGDGNNDTIYGGSGNDQIFGDDNSDQTLYGGSGNDTISGGDNADRIVGGFGADELSGGANSDTFVFLDVRDTGDTIIDYTPGPDTLDFSEIDADQFAPGDQEFLWGGNDATAFGMWFVQDGSDTILYGDTDGNAATAEFMLTLENFSGFADYSEPGDAPPMTWVLL